METNNRYEVKPSEVQLPGRYIFPNTLGRSEYEELAARIVEKCQEKGEWCKIPLKTIRAEIVQDLAATLDDKVTEKVKKPKKGTLPKIKRALGLGGYKHIEKEKPNPNKKRFEEMALEEGADPNRKPAAMSVLAAKLRLPFGGGPAMVDRKIKGMEKEGYIRIVEEGEEAIKPTPKLVKELPRT